MKRGMKILLWVGGTILIVAVGAAVVSRTPLADWVGLNRKPLPTKA